ncbi:hypothetical protein [Micromonospora sp. NBC_01412]|uniref:hypothetical protein n=1 Tax=Micromonospora sp. NBC_01412 TaxID=2903590 RepID=UPI00324482D8
MKVDFVDSQKAEHGVQPVLQALEDTPAQIAPSTYYAAKTRPASARGVAPWSWTLEPWIVMVWGDQESLTDGDEALPGRVQGRRGRVVSVSAWGDDRADR